jgi:hypothetical protein
MKLHRPWKASVLLSVETKVPTMGVFLRFTTNASKKECVAANLSVFLLSSHVFLLSNLRALSKNKNFL